MQNWGILPSASRGGGSKLVSITSCFTQDGQFLVLFPPKLNSVSAERNKKPYETSKAKPVMFPPWKNKFYERRTLKFAMLGSREQHDLTEQNAARHPDPLLRSDRILCI